MLAWLSDVQTALRASTRSVCPPDNTFGAKKNSCLLFLRDRSETSAVPLLLLSKNSLSIPSFFKYEKLTGNTLTGVNRTSLLGTLSVVSSGRIVCNAVKIGDHHITAMFLCRSDHKLCRIRRQPVITVHKLEICSLCPFNSLISRV